MSDIADAHTTDGTLVEGGGAAPVEVALDPINRAVAHLELLSPEARNAVLDRMDPEIAERIRLQLSSLPERPHGKFSNDVVARRKLLREMSERIHATNAARQQQAAAEQTAQAAQPAQSLPPAAAAMPAPPMQGQTMGGTAAAPMVHADPLDALRVLHPAAIARAMQGERAEAWAIVLDRLDVHARGALQMYLEGPARAAIDDARARQAELGATAPQLVQTIESAIARTVVPRAMREHQHLLSTSPPMWDAAAAGMEGSWQHT